MKLASQYKKSGMDMSDAMKRAYKEIDKSLYDIGEQAEDTGDKVGKLGGRFDGLADKLKGGLGVAAKAAGVALSATATAIGKIIKDAVTAYADYEQLVGGVETLFGAGGKSIEEYAQSVGKSVADVEQEYNALMASQNKVLENAQNAYSSAGLSANQYMETVTSFSASLIQSLGGDSELAAEYSDRAVRDMADNANKMGTSMESIMLTYQSLARGNFAMLDNLKLGRQKNMPLAA